MPANWRQLTEFLLLAGDDVRLTWPQLDTIVGGMPDSAISHYPQWWHGDRPNTRAWRAAGFEAREIKPGVSVRFARLATTPSDTGRTVRPHHRDGGASAESPDSLKALDPSRCLVVIPCSASKRSGGRPGVPATAPEDLAAARRNVLQRPDSHADESLVMPAWRRYDGYLYRNCGDVLGDLAASRRLVILSGGYGVLDGDDLIGNYNRPMKPGDWPRGLLERVLADRILQSGLDVVMFAGATTPYAKVLHRTPVRLRDGTTAVLVTQHPHALVFTAKQGDSFNVLVDAIEAHRA